MSYYLKAIIAFIAAECTALGTAIQVDPSHGLTLAGGLVATGGALVTSGLVAWATNGPKPT